eukprot:g24905.t1
MAPVCIHVNLDRMGHFMESDEFYRNQFETKTSNGAERKNNTRKGWERELFDHAYEDAKGFDRVKYGALNVMNDYRGVVKARQYGDSYLVLKDVRLRCTMCSTDSGGMRHNRLGVLDKYAHVLKEYNERELKEPENTKTHQRESPGLVEVAMNATAPSDTMAPSSPELLRGTTADPLKDWITIGFPHLAQDSGQWFFEVHLHEDCAAPQVGLLSSQFQRLPGTKSSQGVGDDQHGWAADGLSASRWHARTLSSQVSVSVAVDLGRRQIFFASDGQWEAQAAFTEEEWDGPDIPLGVALYPAMSVKGKAAFCFGPEFHHGPPPFGSFSRWPNIFGISRIDMPRIGDEEILQLKMLFVVLSVFAFMNCMSGTFVQVFFSQSLEVGVVVAIVGTPALQVSMRWIRDIVGSEQGNAIAPLGFRVINSFFGQVPPKISMLCSVSAMLFGLCMALFIDSLLVMIWGFTSTNAAAQLTMQYLEDLMISFKATPQEKDQPGEAAGLVVMLTTLPLLMQLPSPVSSYQPPPKWQWSDLKSSKVRLCLACCLLQVARNLCRETLLSPSVLARNHALGFQMDRRQRQTGDHGRLRVWTPPERECARERLRKLFEGVISGEEMAALMQAMGSFEIVMGFIVPISCGSFALMGFQTPFCLSPGDPTSPLRRPLHVASLVLCFQEVQIHGEVNLKKHVQRLVAASKYREVPKTQRSYAVRVTGPARVAGKYERMGAHGEMPLYKGDLA